MSPTVVIPAHNSAKFIEETLESVLAQTLPPSEVLVIDDGSTDNTAEVAESFGPRVRVFRTSKSGPSAARNFGVENATSDWVAFADSDDLWEPNKLELQMKELQSHPEADLCYTGMVDLWQMGGEFRLGRVSTISPPGAIRQHLFRGTTFLPSTVVIRRSAFLAAGGFDPHVAVAEDWDLWLRLLHAGTQFVACPEPLVRYRIHPGGISRNAMRLLIEKEHVFGRHVLPHLPFWSRTLRKNLQTSRHEACAAFDLRLAGDKRCLSMMGRSILHAPFHWPHRYKAFAHMLYTRFLHRDPEFTSTSRLSDQMPAKTQLARRGSDTEPAPAPSIHRNL